MISPDFDHRAKEIHETVEAMKLKLADLPDVEMMREALARLEGWVALVEKSMLPEIEVNQ
jgi:hypothetical protein